MNYGGSNNREGRITFSSIILLVIFVSAAALIIAAILWRPWFGDDATVIQAQPTATTDTSVQQPPTASPDPNAPQGP